MQPEFDIAALLAALAPILRQCFGDAQLTALETRSGTFNRVVKFSYGGRHLGVRIALDSRHFRYEKRVIKEIFAVALLQHRDDDIDDERARRIIDTLVATPQGRDLSHPALRPIHYYDWSLRDLPYPFFIFEWVDGVMLWEEPLADHYHAAGRLLAGLHQVRFANFYENIFSIHHVPRSWRDHIRVCLNRELARAELTLPDKVAARLNGLDMSHLLPGRPCLVHNDFSGANVVIDRAGAPHVIDWDNWVVDCAELDLVKMKYWTAIGREGKLTHRSGLFDAFLHGYSSAGGAIDDSRLRAYEHLWLLRCFNFESSIEADDRNSQPTDGWRPLYPDAAYYCDLLQDL